MHRPVAYLLLALVLTTTAALAQAPDARVLYYSGNVRILTSGPPREVAIGMGLMAGDILQVGRGGSLQLSVNGKLFKYTQAGRIDMNFLLVSGAKESNPAVLKAMQMLGRSSLAAGRVKPQSAAGGTLGFAGRLLNLSAQEATIASYASIETEAREPSSVILLEPRSTAVTRGPVRFRWLSTSTDTLFQLLVHDRFGNEVFRAETGDTTVVWEGASQALFPESEYTWTLSGVHDPAVSASASFHKLNDIKGTIAEGGESQIRLELGSDNPALPLVLGAHFANNGCFGEAARWFTTAAEKNPHFYDDFMLLARAQYRGMMGMPEGEVREIYDNRGVLTSR